MNYILTLNIIFMTLGAMDASAVDTIPLAQACVDQDFSQPACYDKIQVTDIKGVSYTQGGKEYSARPSGPGSVVKEGGKFYRVIRNAQGVIGRVEVKAMRILVGAGHCIVRLNSCPFLEQGKNFIQNATSYGNPPGSRKVAFLSRNGFAYSNGDTFTDGNYPDGSDLDKKFHTWGTSGNIPLFDSYDYSQVKAELTSPASGYGYYPNLNVAATLHNAFIDDRQCRKFTPSATTATQASTNFPYVLDTADTFKISYTLPPNSGTAPDMVSAADCCKGNFPTIVGVGFEDRAHFWADFCTLNQTTFNYRLVGTANLLVSTVENIYPPHPVKLPGMRTKVPAIQVDWMGD